MLTGELSGVLGTLTGDESGVLEMPVGDVVMQPFVPDTVGQPLWVGSAEAPGTGAPGAVDDDGV